MEAKMVVKINFRFAFILFGLFLSSLVCAQGSPLELYIEKSVYVPGETVLIFAEVNNLMEYPVFVNLDSFLYDENGNYPLAVIPFDVVLAPNESKKFSLYDIFVEGTMIPGLYTVNTNLFFNDEKIVQKSLNFEIMDTLKEMTLELNLCKDVPCEIKSKVFMKKEDIYLSYVSNQESLEVKLTLIYPDKTTRELILPTSINVDQIGTYEVKIEASKDGYKKVLFIKQFGVIEEGANIQKSILNIDAFEKTENLVDENFEISKYWWVLVVGLLLVGLIIYLIFRRRRGLVIGSPD